MLRIVLALWLTLAPAFAWAGSMSLLGVGKVAAAASYAGPGDIVAGASAWGSCARTYTAALASTSTQLCDLVDASTGATAICTLRGSSTGFVDLTGSYCTGSTTPAAACAAAAGGSCKVKKVYDQTGNGNHAVQATSSAMPALTFAALGGLPCMTFAGAQGLTASPSIGTSQPQTFSAVARITTDQFGGIVGLDVSGHVGIIPTSSVSTWSVYAGSLGTFSATDNTYHAVQGIANGSSSASYLDGTSTTGISSGGASSGSFAIGVQNGAFMVGTACEAGFWDNTSFSLGNQSLVNANQHSSTSGYNF